MSFFPTHYFQLKLLFLRGNEQKKKKNTNSELLINKFSLFYYKTDCLFSKPPFSNLKHNLPRKIVIIIQTVY